MLWDVNKATELFRVKTDAQTLAVAFDERETRLIVASNDKHVSTREVAGGTLLLRIPWEGRCGGPLSLARYVTPNAVQISTERQALAVVYEESPVQIWSLETQRYVGSCIRNAPLDDESKGRKVITAAFHPNPAIPRIVVSYGDMVITVFDVRTCMPVIFDKLGVDYLAVSPNGKALVGKAWRCDLGISDLETLQLQHAVVGDRMGIQGLTFTSDSLRVIDVRVHQTNV